MEGCVSAHLLMVCSSKEMVTPLVQVLVIHLLVSGVAIIFNRILILKNSNF